jgi:hypothetical protein
MVVSLSAAAPAHQYMGLSVFGDLALEFIRLRVSGNGSQGYFHDHILAAGAGHQLSRSGLPAFGPDVLGVFEVEEGPKMLVPPEDHMASATPVTAVGAAPGIGPRPEKMC